MNRKTNVIFRSIDEIIYLRRRYGIIMADPPWMYDSTWGNGTVINHYKQMSVDDIAAMPVGRIARRNAHLYLWYTNPFVREAHRVCDAWGFKYRQTITWVKTRPDGKPRMGLGYYFRGATEHILFATKGALPRRNKSMLNVVDHVGGGEAAYLPLGRHSVKPDQFMDMAVQYSGQLKRIELFARRTRRDWDSLGDAGSLRKGKYHERAPRRSARRSARRPAPRAVQAARVPARRRRR